MSLNSIAIPFLSVPLNLISFLAMSAPSRPNDIQFYSNLTLTLSVPFHSNAFHSNLFVSFRFHSALFKLHASLFLLILLHSLLPTSTRGLINAVQFYNEE